MRQIAETYGMIGRMMTMALLLGVAVAVPTVLASQKWDIGVASIVSLVAVMLFLPPWVYLTYWWVEGEWPPR